MTKLSAGLLLFRFDARRELQVLLVHPGGPFWAKKDRGVWSIPKGEVDGDEEPSAVAEREFLEELGQPPPTGTRISLGEITQRGGKRVRAWAVEGDISTAAVVSNEFEMEWPPRSGRMQSFPEVDRAAWVAIGQAHEKLVEAQTELLDRLCSRLPAGGDTSGG